MSAPHNRCPFDPDNTTLLTGTACRITPPPNPLPEAERGRGEGFSRRPRTACRHGCLLVALVAAWAVPGTARGDKMDWVEVGKDRKSFALAASARRFVPWGFN